MTSIFMTMIHLHLGVCVINQGVEESSVDLMTSMKYAGGAALTGGAASAANMLFGVSVIGLLVFQFARSTLLGRRMQWHSNDFVWFCCTILINFAQLIMTLSFWESKGGTIHPAEAAGTRPIASVVQRRWLWGCGWGQPFPALNIRNDMQW